MTAAQRVPAKLVTVAMIRDELGWTTKQAEALFRVIAREDGIVRLAGFRHVYVKRSDYERRLSAAGAMEWA